MNIYFSENLKKFRKERNLTQESLADFLGVTFQAISKWERGEGYPDITTLPVISTFFGITLDELLGVNRAETEDELVTLINEYDNLDHIESRKEMLEKLIQISPNDFRVLLRELGFLVHFGEKQKSFARINAIYDKIQQNCNNDRIRICATRHIIIFYADLAKQKNSSVTFDDVEKLLEKMPFMRDGQEFISSYLYPKSHPEYYKKIQEAIEEGIGLVDTSVNHYYLYDDHFSVGYKIDMLEKSIHIKSIIYDDGHFGEQWQQIIYDYGHLGHLYFEIGKNKKAIRNLRKCAELAKQFDNLERYTTMHSKLFEGRIFDKHKLGSTYVATARIKYLMEEKYPLSEDFKNTKEFKEILDMMKK